MLFALDNPVFATFALTAALTAFKIIGQGWVVIWVMMRAHAGWAAPEDLRAGPLNPAPDPSQMTEPEAVARARRMHRNDLENIPAFWAAGLVLVAADPPLWAAQVLMWGFVAARAGHAWAYGTAQRHETRATFYTVATILTAIMLVWGIAAAL